MRAIRRKGQKATAAVRRKTINGQLLDVAAASAFLGCSEQTVRKRATRHLLPARKFLNRIVFRRADLESLINDLPGITLEEVRQNLARREKGSR